MEKRPWTCGCVRYSIWQDLISPLRRGDAFMLKGAGLWRKSGRVDGTVVVSRKRLIGNDSLAGWMGWERE